MPRKTTTGLNRAVQEYLLPGGNFQQLMLQVPASRQRKYLWGFSVSLSLPAGSFPVTATDLLSRVVVAIGQIPEDDASMTLLDLSPWAAGQSFPRIPGASSILYDMTFKNEHRRDLTSPIIAYEGDTLSILVGLPWVTGDNSATPDGGVVYLSWNGNAGEEGTSFPYRLR